MTDAALPPSAAARAQAFCQRYSLRHPILLAPMAGACPPALSIAVMQAGGLGACGALLMAPPTIVDWAAAVRAATPGPFQINLWVPDPAPLRNAAHEQALCNFLGGFGPAVSPSAGDATPPDFAAQCQALLAAHPTIVSSVMGLFPPAFVQQLKAAGITWWANISTVAEARAAEAAGADVVVAQGMEAGGHRGCFDATLAEAQQVGLFALLPAVADAVRLPVVATGGIADARGVAAAFALGASAVQVGTGFLRTPEAALPAAWADAPGPLRTRRHLPHARVQRPRRAQHPHRLCAGRGRARCAGTGALPGAARADGGHAPAGRPGRRRAAYAGLGRPGGAAGAGPASGTGAAVAGCRAAGLSACPAPDREPVSPAAESACTRRSTRSPSSRGLPTLGTKASYWLKPARTAASSRPLCMAILVAAVRWSCRRARPTARPSMPGISTSSTMASKAWCQAASSAADPLSTACTR